VVTPTLDISAQNGAIMLSGSVPTESQRQMIHSIARNTTGVLAVNDQMKVVPPPPANYGTVTPTYGQSDQAIANQVQQALYSHPTASRCAPGVRIMVQGGRVTLTGNLGSEQDRSVVDEVVRNVPGVIGVTDQMQIVTLPTGRVQEPTRVYAPPPSAPPPSADNFSLHVQGLNDADRALAQRILDGVQTETSVNRSWPGVTINVADGRVILQGTVQSYDQKRAIVESVRRAAGASNVYDEIRVVP
jgi:osmotically-inducible protein OsmY